MASMIDKILGFLGVQDEYDDEEEEHYTTPYYDRAETDANVYRLTRQRRPAEKESAPARKGNLVSLTGGQRVQAKMIILEPIAFEDVRDYVVHLKGKRALIVRLNRVEKAEAQRIVDFMAGATHALEGNMRKLGERIFCFAPPSVEIEGDVASDFYDLDAD